MSKVFSEADQRFMREALALAERGRGRTRPNPVVGALLVRGGRVLARGYHRRSGLPHAEIEALSHKGVRTQGATLYVTLDPAATRVAPAPAPRPSSVPVSAVWWWGAATRIRWSAVAASCTCVAPASASTWAASTRNAEKQNRAFFVWVRAHRPWVALKVASTLDGFIASKQTKLRDPSARFVTGTAARAHAHVLRGQHDAVLVGVGTVLADNPRLTVRLPGASKAGPLRVVLDGHLRTPPSARLIRQLGAPPALIIGAQPGKGAKDARARLARERALRRAGAEVLLLPADRAGRISIPHLLRALAEGGVQSLLVEGGSRIHGAFISACRVDSVAFFLAPRLVGAGRPIVEGTGLDWRTPLRLGPLQVHAIAKISLWRPTCWVPNCADDPSTTD